MSRADDLLKRLDESEPRGLPQIALLMQRMQADGFIKGYVIGGSTAIVFYSEPFHTEDVDVFCYYADELANDIRPFRTRMEELGAISRGMYYYVDGIKVQLQPMENADAIEKEAFQTAKTVQIEGVPVKVLQLEYAMAVKVNANRDTDWNHIAIAIRSADPDMTVLLDILEHFGLLNRWRQHYA